MTNIVGQAESFRAARPVYDHMLPRGKAAVAGPDISWQLTISISFPSHFHSFSYFSIFVHIFPYLFILFPHFPICFDIFDILQLQRFRVFELCRQIWAAALDGMTYSAHWVLNI